MEVNTNTQVNTVSKSSKNSSLQTGTSTFEILQKEQKDPKKITFTEYQQLSHEDIEKLFGKYNDNEREATKLLDMAQITDDKTLNEVFFENTLKEFKNGGDFTKLSSFAILSANPLDTQAELDYIFDPDNIENMAFTAEQRRSPFFQELLSKKDGYIPPKPVYENQIDIHDSKQLLEYFHNFKKYFEEKIDSPKKTFAFEINELFQTVDGILESYEQKVNEKNATLANYTSNNTATQNKVDQAQENSNENNKIKEEERFERIKKLVEDIKSVLRTGFTVEELEQMEKLIAQIQKLMKEKDSNNDVEIGAKIKELEEALAAMQKKVFGEVIIELDDKNKEDSKIADSNGFQKRLDSIITQLEEMKSGKAKDAEEFDKAMEAHGFNPDSDLEILTFKFMQQGYSKGEAMERSNLYSQAGLLPDYELEKKFGIKVYNISFLAFNPEYKQSLMESFEKMDTETLQGVIQTIGFSDAFSVDIEDAKKIMPRDGSKTHEEVMKGWEQYWNDKYGTPEKMMAMFDTVLHQHEINQKFSTKDLSYIKTGIDILIDAYQENL